MYIQQKQSLKENTPRVNPVCVSSNLTLVSHRHPTASCYETIQSGINTERLALLNAASKEMERTFRAISAYSRMLEDLRLSAASASAVIQNYFEFDDVAELGKNLKYISNAFNLITHDTLTARETAGSVDIAALTVELLDLLEPSMERRNLHLEFHQQADMPLTVIDETVARHILWGLYYLMIKYAALEATLSVTLTRDEGGELIVTAEINAINRELVPHGNTDFYPCVAPHRQNITPRLLPQLGQHVNTKIARYFLHRNNGRLLIQSTAKNTVRMVAVFG